MLQPFENLIEREDLPFDINPKADPESERLRIAELERLMGEINSLHTSIEKGRKNIPYWEMPRGRKRLNATLAAVRNFKGQKPRKKR